MCVGRDEPEDRGGSNDAMCLIAALLLTSPSVANPPRGDNAQFDEPGLDGRQEPPALHRALPSVTRLVEEQGGFHGFEHSLTA